MGGRDIYNVGMTSKGNVRCTEKARALCLMLALTPGGHSMARHVRYLFIEIWTKHNRQRPVTAERITPSCGVASTRGVRGTRES
jgi:hypothetical protein